MVWMLLGLPLTAVVAGVVTVVIAFQNQDGLVTEDVRKLGFATTQVNEREARAADMGLAAELAVGDAVLRLTISGRPQALAEHLTLRLVHPTQVGQDQFVNFIRTAPGQYEAPRPAAFSGKRTLVLEPADQRWRLGGVWPAELQGGGISLAAANSNPPPPHP
jgi:hypothetical protein